jgi:hypothetical protein
VLALLAAIATIAAGLGGCASPGSTAQSTATGKPKPTASSVPTGLRVNPVDDGLFCATQVAWSPDSTRIAVVGNGENCSGAASGRTPGLILVYAAASGSVIQKLQPDTAVLALPTIAQQVAANSASGGTISTLTYQSLTWTPDGQALLMTFDLELQPNPNAGSMGVYGLQRLGVSDPSLTEVWLDTAASHFAQLERWDLQAGAADVPPAPVKASAYQWNADGTLAPAGPARQAVGAPDGGETFTVWQPGRLLFGTQSDKATGSTTVIAQDVGWVSNASPVSPDGHYLYPNMINAGSLVPPSTQQTVVGELVLQPHDQALVALARQMMRTPSPDQNTSILVAWRPDGSYLAALAPGAAAPSPAAFTTSIYDTASGKLVKQVMPDFTGRGASPAGRGASVALLWSPDGSSLLLVDDIYGVITVWGPGALPA